MMKLLIVTSVEQYNKDVLKLFDEAGIESFSGSEIDGYRKLDPMIMTHSWFAGEPGGAESRMFFSFTKENNVKAMFQAIENHNKLIGAGNPIRAVVLPIENYI